MREHIRNVECRPHLSSIYLASPRSSSPHVASFKVQTDRGDRKRWCVRLVQKTKSSIHSRPEYIDLGRGEGRRLHHQHLLEGRKAQMLILGSLDFLRMWKNDSKIPKFRMDCPSPEERVLLQLIVRKLRPYSCWSLTSKGLILNCSRTSWPAYTILVPSLLGDCIDLVHRERMQRCIMSWATSEF